MGLYTEKDLKEQLAKMEEENKYYWAGYWEDTLTEGLMNKYTLSYTTAKQYAENIIDKLVSMGKYRKGQ